MSVNKPFYHSKQSIPSHPVYQKLTSQELSVDDVTDTFRFTIQGKHLAFTIFEAMGLQFDKKLNWTFEADSQNLVEGKISKIGTKRGKLHELQICQPDEQQPDEAESRSQSCESNQNVARMQRKRRNIPKDFRSSPKRRCLRIPVESPNKHSAIAVHGSPAKTHKDDTQSTSNSVNRLLNLNSGCTDEMDTSIEHLFLQSNVEDDLIDAYNIHSRQTSGKELWIQMKADDAFKHSFKDLTTKQMKEMMRKIIHQGNRLELSAKNNST